MKGQVSAEMILLLVALIALVAIIASNLIKAGKTASGGIANKTENLTSTVTGMCIMDSDCPSGKCVDGQCVEQ